jgi:hypothetical protein
VGSARRDAAPQLFEEEAGQADLVAVALLGGAGGEALEGEARLLLEAVLRGLGAEVPERVPEVGFQAQGVAPGVEGGLGPAELVEGDA